MGKEKLIKICNTVAFIFALSFLLKLVRDIFVYHSGLNSAPFYIWVMVDAARYLLPAAFVFLVGRIVKYKKNREDKEKEEN